ncbi:MAG: cation:proton antiporter [Rhodospirillales bacterium]|nr:cation:proton antiporter [Rhodospirillales bacterium]
MEAHGADLTGIAIVMAVAVAAGLALQRLKQPAIVGYILAGIVLGPSGAALVQQSTQIALLAELGVVLLLFLIGMELSLKAFARVVRPAGLTALGQIAASLAVTFVFGWWLDWPVKQSVLLGFIIALSSTAVAIKMLDSIGELRSDIGQITIGVMIAQDIAVVPILILVGSLGDNEPLGYDVVVKIVIAIALLVAFIVVLSRRGKLDLPFTDAVRGKVDLLTLAALAFAFIAASTTGVLGLSPAYGAFLAGLVIANSTLRAEAIHVTEPIQSVLLVVFFLSIGLLIDVRFIWANIGTVILFVIGVTALKTVLNVWLLRMVREPWDRAFPAGLIMAQVGEFSFILAAVGVKNGAISADGYRLAISVIAISLLVSPFWMHTIRRFHVVASHGMTSFREAFAEVYADEIADIERGTVLARRYANALRRQIQTVRLAWQKHRARKTDMSAPVAPAAAPETGAPEPPPAERSDKPGPGG